MTSSLNINTGSGNLTFDITTGAPSTTKTTPTGSSTVSTLSSLGSSNGFQQVYINSPGLPSIPVPLPPPYSDPSGLANLGKYVAAQTQATFTSAAANLTPTPSDNFLSTMGTLISNLTPQQLLSLGSPPLSSEQVEAQLQFAILNPDADLPQAMQDMAGQITSQVEQQTGVQLSDVNPAYKELYDAAMSFGQNALIQSSLMSNTSLSAADRQEILTAWNLGAEDLLPPNLLAALNTAKAYASGIIQQEYGCPADWPIANNGDSTKAALGTAYDTQFNEALQAQLNNGTITQAQYDQLLSMHYGESTGSSDMQALLASIENPILAQLTTTYGMPPGYIPQIDNTEFNNYLNASYLTTFNGLLNSQDPPLTPDQIKALGQALTSSAAASSLPPALQKLLNQLQTQTLSQIIEAFGLPNTWVPNANSLLAASTPNPEFAPAQNAIDATDEYMNGLTEQIKSAVAGGQMSPADGTNYLNFLKTINNALIGLQNGLYQLQMGTANLNSAFTKVQYDEKMNEIQEQQAALAQEQALQGQQSSKQQTMSVVNTVFNWIANIILMVVCPPAAVYLLVQASQQGKLNANFSMTTALEQDLVTLGESIGLSSQLSTILGTILLAICPLTMYMVAADVLLGNGDFVNNFFLACGVSAANAQIATMCVQIIAQVIVDIVISVATLGAGSEVFLDIVNTVKSTLVAAVKYIAKTGIRQILRDLMDALKTALVSAGRAIAKEVTTGFPELEKAVMTVLNALRKGFEEGWAEFVKFLKNLKNVAENLKSIGRSFVGFFTDDLDAAQKVQRAEKILNMYQTISGSVQSGLSEIYQGKNLLLQAQLDLIQGELDAYMTNVDQMIAMIKNLIQKLQDLLNGLGTWISSVGSQIQQMWQGNSSCMTALANACA